MIASCNPNDPVLLEPRYRLATTTTTTTTAGAGAGSGDVELQSPSTTNGMNTLQHQHQQQTAHLLSSPEFIGRSNNGVEGGAGVANGAEAAAAAAAVGSGGGVVSSFVPLAAAPIAALISATQNDDDVSSSPSASAASAAGGAGADPGVGSPRGTDPAAEPLASSSEDHSHFPSLALLKSTVSSRLLWSFAIANFMTMIPILSVTFFLPAVIATFIGSSQTIMANLLSSIPYAGASLTMYLNSRYEYELNSYAFSSLSLSPD